jgi:hypothetical protein
VGMPNSEVGGSMLLQNVGNCLKSAWCNIVVYLNISSVLLSEPHISQILSPYGRLVSWASEHQIIATHYELDGPGLYPGRCKIFRTHPDWLWGRPSLLYNGYRVSSTGVNWLGCGTDHPTPSSTEIKERVELLSLLPLWAFMVCSRMNFTFDLYQ